MGRFAVLTGAGTLSGAVVLVDTESHMLYLTMLNRRDSFLLCLPSVSACRSIGTHSVTISDSSHLYVIPSIRLNRLHDREQGGMAGSARSRSCSWAEHELQI